MQSACLRAEGGMTMRKLLSAGFMRLRKVKVFWVVLLFMMGLGLFIVVQGCLDIIRYGEYGMYDDWLFAYVSFVPICCAVFCSSFLGTEYSDGTIRNKLIVGHKRREIYLTNLIVIFVAALFMTGAFLLVYCPLGALVTLPPKLTTGAILRYLTVSLFTTAAFVSIFNMIAMLISNKAVSAVVCILFFFVLLLAAVVIYGRLEAPETFVEYFMTIDGVDVSEPKPNPRYLQGIAREIYQFFFDLFPSGQAVQLAGKMVQHPFRMMFCSVGIVIVTNISGIRAFGRKNLR